MFLMIHFFLMFLWVQTEYARVYYGYRIFFAHMVPILPTLAVSSLLFINFQFNMYIGFINIHLETLNILVREQLLDESSDQKALLLHIIQAIKISPPKNNESKISTMYVMYQSIKEMSNCVNDALGFVSVMQCHAMSLCSNLIAFGYTILRDISGTLSSAYIIFSVRFKALTKLIKNFKYFQNRALFLDMHLHLLILHNVQSDSENGNNC